MAFWWVGTGHEELDQPVGAAFRTMIGALPVGCAFPGRDQAWAGWLARDARR
jgi:hypothetical protein